MVCALHDKEALRHFRMQPQSPFREAMGRLAAYARMRFTALLFVATLLVGCATSRDDVRLQGTWFLNPFATATETFHQDPLWTNAPPAVVERFRNMPRSVVVTYAHGAEIVRGDEAQYGYYDVVFHYYVVERGSNYVIIRTTAPVDKGRDIRIRFINEGIMYWIDDGPLGFGIPERFDKLLRETSKPLPLGWGGMIPSPEVPLSIDSPTNWWFMNYAPPNTALEPLR